MQNQLALFPREGRIEATHLQCATWKLHDLQMPDIWGHVVEIDLYIEGMTLAGRYGTPQRLHHLLHGSQPTS